MKTGKCSFRRFAMLFFLAAFLWAAVNAVINMAERNCGFLYFGIWLIAVAAMIPAAAAVRRMLTDTPAGRSIRKSAAIWELSLAALLLAAGTVFRLLIIRSLPVEPKSDYEIYYAIARMLLRGTLVTEGAGYCEYIAKFPHVLGYPTVLSWFFRLAGVSVANAQLFNLLLQMLSCVIVWRIARILGGRVSGLTALALTALLPSTILYSSILGSEALFTFLLLICVWIFVRLIQRTGIQEAHPWLYPAGIILMALMLAFASSVRPMGIIFLIAASICICTIRTPEAPLSGQQKKTSVTRLTDRRWKRCLILVLFYLIGSSILSANTAHVIGQKPASASASFGYNLMVGLNPENNGAWNQNDAEFLDRAYQETGSAQDAQAACRDLAAERFKSTYPELPRLFAIKFSDLWKNDDYGVNWNHDFLSEQGDLTPERNTLLETMRVIGNMFYLFMMTGTVIYGFIRFRKEADAGYALILLLCGTAALHVFVETQNRYHYYTLPVFAILGSLGWLTVYRRAEDSGIRALIPRLPARRQKRVLPSDPRKKAGDSCAHAGNR